MSFRRIHPYVTIVTLAALDGGTLACAWIVACLTASGHNVFRALGGSSPLLFIGTVLLWWECARRGRLYESHRGKPLPLHMLHAAYQVAWWAIGSLFFLICLSPWLGRTFLLAFACSGSLFLLWQRVLFRLSVSTARLWGYNAERALIVGSNPCTDRVVRLIQARPQLGTDIVGYLESDERAKTLLAQRGLAYLGPITALKEVLRERVIDVVYVPSPMRLNYGLLQDIVRECEEIGVDVKMIADLFPRSVGSFSLGRVGVMPAICIVPWRGEPGQETNQTRVMDRLMAAALIMALAPVFLAAAVLIRLESAGPVLVAEPGRPWRFRARREDGAAGPLMASLGGVTFSGHFLCRHGLDEIPWLFNMVRGEMAASAEDAALRDHSCAECGRCVPAADVQDAGETLAVPAFARSQPEPARSGYDSGGGMSGELK